jgi:hypothetical protein
MAHALAAESNSGERIRMLVAEYLPQVELDPALADVAPRFDLATVERVVRNLSASPQRRAIVRVSALESIEDHGHRQLVFELDRTLTLDERLSVAAELDERLRSDATIDFDIALRDTTFGV